MELLEKQLSHLRRDPVMRALIKKLPAVTHVWYSAPKRDHFRALVVAIVNQQLSGKAAATILARFIALFSDKKFPEPADVLKMSVPKLRKVGLSRMKISFLKDLSRHVIAGTVDFKAMKKMSDSDVIEHLVRVKGIGRWTAEMFLMFSLRREDIFSYGDLGLRNAMETQYGLKKHPTERVAEKISAAWAPYRTLASLYLWASIDTKFGETKKKK